MAKYIIKLESLPANCDECPCVQWDSNVENYCWCGITSETACTDKRASKCPIEECESGAVVSSDPCDKTDNSNVSNTVSLFDLALIFSVLSWVIITAINS